MDYIFYHVIHDECYTKIRDDTILEYVYDLYKNNKYVDCDDELYLNYAGIHAKHNAKDDLSEKLFLMAIEKGYIKSMHNLALLYYRQNKRELAEKYCIMAINRGHRSSMFNLVLWDDRRRRYERSVKIENEIIKHNFNLDDSIKLINVLSDHNQNVFNDILKFIVINGMN